MTLLADLPSLFAPYESGVKVPLTGISLNGVDLSDLFAPVSAGSQIPNNTGIAVAGQDLKALFAAAGTTIKLIDTWIGTYADTRYASGTVVASVGLAFLPNNTYNGGGRSGNWLAAGFNSADYEIKATVISGDALQSNNMSGFVPIDTTRLITQSATALPSTFQSKETVVEITIRLIADHAVSITRLVTLLVAAESFGPEGSLVP